MHSHPVTRTCSVGQAAGGKSVLGVASRRSGSAHSAGSTQPTASADNTQRSSVRAGGVWEGGGAERGGAERVGECGGESGWVGWVGGVGR